MSGDLARSDVFYGLLWESIDSYEDTDGTTVFDYSSGEVAVFNAFKILFFTEGQEATSTNIYMRLNGDDSANYYFNYVGAGSLVKPRMRRSWY